MRGNQKEWEEVGNKNQAAEQSREEAKRRPLDAGLFPVQWEAFGKQKTAVCVGQLFPCANSLCALKHVRIQASSVREQRHRVCPVSVQENLQGWTICSLPLVDFRFNYFTPIKHNGTTMWSSCRWIQIFCLPVAGCVHALWQHWLQEMLGNRPRFAALFIHCYVIHG